jgi:Icc-related predicted phosphoesterase
VAAVGDLHSSRFSTGAATRLFADMQAVADVIVLCGDLTDYGLVDEGRLLARDLAAVRVPVVSVLGNHDYESSQEGELREILRAAGVIVLDGDSCELLGVGFAGVKGFCGGFGRRTLGSWGESIVKQFVQEAMSEALKLETALARLRSAARMVVLHYAPIVDTVRGEPEDIFPFLGTSRLEDPINRYNVAAVVHGHAHRGAPEGRTTSNVPVYNVSLPLLQRLTPAQPFKVIELPATDDTSGLPR